MSKNEPPTPPVIKDEDGKPIDPFAEVLNVLSYEQIMVIRKRLEMIGRKEMVKILSFELKARQAINRQNDEVHDQIVQKIRDRENDRKKEK